VRLVHQQVQQRPARLHHPGAPADDLHPLGGPRAVVHLAQAQPEDAQRRRPLGGGLVRRAHLGAGDHAAGPPRAARSDSSARISEVAGYRSASPSSSRGGATERIERLIGAALTLRSKSSRRARLKTIPAHSAPSCCSRRRAACTSLGFCPAETISTTRSASGQTRPASRLPRIGPVSMMTRSNRPRSCSSRWSKSAAESFSGLKSWFEPAGIAHRFGTRVWCTSPLSAALPTRSP